MASRNSAGLLRCAFFFVVLFLACLGPDARSNALSCLDESGAPVDWWIILKAANIAGNEASQQGYGYAYADASNPVLQLTGKRLDSNLSGALGSTFDQIYSASSSTTGWLMYNDQTPDNKEHGSFGHTKGAVGFTRDGGFWLVHSTPRFPDASTSSYTGFPEYAKEYGQAFFCTTYDLKNLDKIGGGFLLNKPYVYSSNIPSSLSSSLPQMESVLEGSFVTREVASNATQIVTKGGLQLVAFSKNEKWNQDLYSELVEPALQADLLIETWMNGANTNKMPTFCKPDYPYNSINIREVSLTSDLSWPETHDHSKWAVGTDKSSFLFCIGDINRQYSQAKRGGGAVCASHRYIWASLNKIISSSDSC